MDFDKPPYWEICKVTTCDDHFKVMYQDYDEKIHLADVNFTDGSWYFRTGVHYEILYDDAINRFRDSMRWWCSFMNDDESQRKLILEFHIGNSTTTTKDVKVFYVDENGSWQNKTWSFDRYDGFFEIYLPDVPEGEMYKIKRFETSNTSMSDIVDWLLNDIKSKCNDKFMLYIDLG